jgi:hypothetical protein
MTDGAAKRRQLDRLATSLRHFGLKDEFEIGELLDGGAVPSDDALGRRIRRFRELLPASITPEFLAGYVGTELRRDRPRDVGDGHPAPGDRSPAGAAAAADPPLSAADVDEFATITTGRTHMQREARRYQHHVFRVLRHVFAERLTPSAAPALSDPRLEVPRHKGRMRVDIQFRVAGGQGFFADLGPRHGIKAPFVPVECKNHGRDPKNDEFGQLSSRLNAKVGAFGLLACRTIRDRDGTDDLARAYTQKGTPEYLVALDDVDLATLIGARLRGDEHAIDALLNRRLDALLLH